MSKQRHQHQPRKKKKEEKTTTRSTITTTIAAGSSFLLCSTLLFMNIFSSIFSSVGGRTAASASASVSATVNNNIPIPIPLTTSKIAASTTVASVMATSSSETIEDVADRDQQQQLEDRLRGALWGFFAGDALSAPTHWYYGGRRQIKSDYGHAINDYTKPNYNLVGSILNKSDLNGGGRSKNIMSSRGGTGGWSPFGKKGGGSGSSKDHSDVKSIIGQVINHGKQDLWSPSQQIHYHATLQKGENTLEASIARVLMKSIVTNGGRFNEEHFRHSYVEFMTTPDSHNDTYASTCHRMFFANLVYGQKDPKDCPDNDSHNVDTIDGLVLPTIVALAGSGDRDAADSQSAAAAKCASVTRKSIILERVSSAWTKVVESALTNNNDNNDKNFADEFNNFAKQTINRKPNPNVSDSSTMSACYLSQALPGMLDLIAKYNVVDDHGSGSGNGNGGDVTKNINNNLVWEGLLANANVGGENVHRGSVMGAMLGARAGYKSLPPRLMDGLYPHDELEQEIDDFVKAVISSSSSSSSS
mmetsp:Transcript_31450/g.76117  ORF Transcript_31450/g.76117 Transcript_31450/m.76117 type:complete len:530 (+) Transcript_31450:141-1730(+)